MRPSDKNGVLRTRPPTPTSNVTSESRSRAASDARIKSSDARITRSLSAAVLCSAFGAGSDTTRIRSSGGCGSGVSELDGPADMCGVYSPADDA